MSDNPVTNNFNPNDIANVDQNIYGLPFILDNANIVILPVPWDVTTSYRRGTAHAPEQIFNASFQVDLYDPIVKNAWKIGITMDDIPEYWLEMNEKFSKKAELYIDFLAHGGDILESQRMQEILLKINAASNELNEWVRTSALEYINQNKMVVLLGGDHSCPLGLIKAMATKNDTFGILHLDAHADLRNAYEGFEFSHASIMYHAAKIPQVSKIVQVGIRDYCEEELDAIKAQPKISTFFDRNIKQQLFEGGNWRNICNEIVAQLPEKVYISFDVDGLDPKLCPNTGTPVPGGFDYAEVLYLFEQLLLQGKKIIAFDLCETGNSTNEWDANVAARLLYRICNIMAVSNGIKP